MGCHSSKGTEVIEESQKPGDHLDGGEPKVEPGTEAVDYKDTSMEEGTPELKT
ncbi:CHD9 neighbor protein [Arvicanthis niloticus]|uniref:CHD9 neighbor protein n=1 Tax=Arvicanthis niloticus TaxID=61156 RepID=UPI00402B5CC4